MYFFVYIVNRLTVWTLRDPFFNAFGMVMCVLTVKETKECVLDNVG